MMAKWGTDCMKRITATCFHYDYRANKWQSHNHTHTQTHIQSNIHDIVQ